MTCQVKIHVDSWGNARNVRRNRPRDSEGCGLVVPAESVVDFYDLGADIMLGIYAKCQATKTITLVDGSGLCVRPWKASALATSVA